MEQWLSAADPRSVLMVAPLALALAMARWLGLTLLLPVFSRTGIETLTRGGFAFAMSAPLVPEAFTVVSALDPFQSIWHIGLLAGKELCIGLVLGLILGIPFWGAEMAGEALDVQRGSAVGTIADPQGLNEASVLGTFFAITTIALFLLAGGIGVVASLVYDSFRLWPMANFVPSVAIGFETLILGLLSKLMLIGMLIAAPIVVVALCCDVLLGFVAKLAPQLNANILGAAVKSLVIAALFVVYARTFTEDLTDATLAIVTTLDTIEASGR